MKDNFEISYRNYSALSEILLDKSFKLSCRIHIHLWDKDAEREGE